MSTPEWINMSLPGPEHRSERVIVDTGEPFLSVIAGDEGVVIVDLGHCLRPGDTITAIRCATHAETPGNSTVSLETKPHDLSSWSTVCVRGGFGDGTSTQSLALPHPLVVAEGACHRLRVTIDGLTGFSDIDLYSVGVEVLRGSH